MAIKGINQNFNPENIPEGFAYWIKNGILSIKFDAVVNENGNKIDINISILNIRFINGVTVFGRNIILFYKSNLGKDEIAVIDEITKSITVKVSRIDLNFLQTNPIFATCKYNSQNQLIIAFVDGNNSDKYINLDTVQPSDVLNFYNLFPLIQNPSSITTTVLDSGSLTTGAYLFTFQYISKDGSRSQWTTFSDPTYITLHDQNKGFTQTKGVDTNKASTKSISCRLNSIDTSYSKISIAVVSKIANVVSSKVIKEVYTSSAIFGTLTFVYNGSEDIGTVSIPELVTTNVSYRSSKHITSLNDQLFLADIVSNPVVDYQSIANQTIIKWRSTPAYTLATSSKYKDGNIKTFNHDEVYAMYIQFEDIQTGDFTNWFHIPGRISFGTDLNDSVLSTGGLQVNGVTPKRYQIEDTCSWDNTTNVDGSRSGTMGFWQNDNETYPNTSSWTGLAGQKVRHHKFPSVEFMYGVWADQAISGNIPYGIDRLDILDIDVINSSIDFTKVKGYRIGYAKRSLSNINVLGMGLTIMAAYPESGDQNQLMTSGGNFTIDNSSEGGTIPKKDYIRFNSFDIFQDRPAINNCYLRNYIALSAKALDTIGETDYGRVFGGASGKNFISYASNFTKLASNSRSVSSAVPAGDKIRALSKQQYVTNNVKINADTLTIENTGAEETLLAKVESTNLALYTGADSTIYTFVGSSISANANFKEDTYLAALKTVKTDFYLGFDNQTIIANSQIVRNNTNNKLANIGDSFLGVYSYAALGYYSNSSLNLPGINTNLNSGIINFKVHVGVFRHNVNQRFINAGDYSTYFYPDAGVFDKTTNQENYWFSPTFYTRDKQWNNFQYSKDFSYINDLNVDGIFNLQSVNQNNYNYRIIRSQRASRENTLGDGWRTFKPLDYFETVKDKGRITNLLAWGTDALIIHHERGLFRTRDKAVLQTNILNITLGSGDLFAIEPKEESATPTGTGGTQHKYSCLLADFGYLFVDEETKDVYIYDGNKLEDFRKGLMKFFDENLLCKKDNPLFTDGIGMAFDNYNNRIILYQKAIKTIQTNLDDEGNYSTSDVTTGFTISYDKNQQQWVSAHDFIPDLLFNTRDNLYSISNNILRTHNVGNKGEYNGVIYPFYVDFIVNTKPELQKVLYAIAWTTKYKTTSNTFDPRKTITHVRVWNDQHSTKRIAIVTNETESLFVDANAKIVDQTWHFDDLNNSVIDLSFPFTDTLLNDSKPIDSNLETPVWHDSEPLRGKYFIVRLEYDNIQNKEVYLRELFAKLRKSNS